jgi:hypothetical protein
MKGMILEKKASPVIVYVDKKCLSPSHKDDGHLEFEDSTAEVNSLSQTDVECPGQT